MREIVRPTVVHLFGQHWLLPVEAGKNAVPDVIMLEWIRRGIDDQELEKLVRQIQAEGQARIVNECLKRRAGKTDPPPSTVRPIRPDSPPSVA